MTILLGIAVGSLLLSGFIFLIFWGIGGAITLFAPSFNTSINSAITTMGEKVGSVYHLIPGADALINILAAMLIISAGYFMLRFGVFVYNETTHSGGAI